MSKLSKFWKSSLRNLGGGGRREGGEFTFILQAAKTNMDVIVLQNIFTHSQPLN